MGNTHVVPVFGEPGTGVKYWVYSFKKNGRWEGALCCLSKQDAHREARNRRKRDVAQRKAEQSRKKHTKLTPERIRQIEAKALRKLGTPTRELNPNTLRINKFFVNQNGSDSNDGSYDYPLKSIQKALTKLHKTKAHV